MSAESLGAQEGISIDGKGDNLDFDSGKERTGRWARLVLEIELSYHGVSFDGWQKQPGLNTVQG